MRPVTVTINANRKYKSVNTDKLEEHYMYDEAMQLIALAKNDEQYFKRIEDLKQRQLELVHVMEIVRVFNEVDMHMAKVK